VSRTSLRSLDWFTFFLADIQTGFGPFVAVFLTARAWSQVDIGLVLTVGGLVSMAVQMPAGALVDAVHARRLLALLAVAAISVSALVMAVWPVFPIVVGSRILQAVASSILGPIIAALSLTLVGHAALGERLGRNARFASIGSGVAAAVMGLTGYLVSNQAVFYLTGLLAMPALLALAGIRTAEFGRPSSRRHGEDGLPRAKAGVRDLMGNRLLLSFAGCVLLFHLANAAMLPSMAGFLTPRCGSWATTVVAACMLVPQLVVAAFSPWIGRQSQTWGRRPPLLVGFAALVVRGLVFALVADPVVVIAAQVLDGISAAVLGVMFPLVIVDITRGTGRFNLALGMVSTVMGLGAALSTTLAGYLIDHYGGTMFFGLAAIAAVGLALVFILMPETRPEPEESASLDHTFRPKLAAL
jgi:MFS family permease